MRQLFRAARTTFCGAMVASPRRFLQQGGIGAVSDGPPQVFNRHVKRLQRDAAAASTDFAEGVACAIGARRGEAPRWEHRDWEHAASDRDVRVLMHDMAEAAAGRDLGYDLG